MPPGDGPVLSTDGVQERRAGSVDLPGVPLAANPVRRFVSGEVVRTLTQARGRPVAWAVRHRAVGGQLGKEK
ncbi:hypothetical protein DEJ46_38825 [Streptomyces venezuelae]|uniref:Uncharacterized protein n=1 Tax=Streptomyces venezuelae TaxID=54571 RepID=A0A5P2B1C8_STRVZ|nr:hypothetical protein DEJ46_38825 [Streptomyces venezuelae]